MFKRSSSRLSTRWNGQRRAVLVEPLSARPFRHRIARGYSVHELATAAGVFAGTIKCLESGKPADKRVLPALATALNVPFCGLVCGAHNRIERACFSLMQPCWLQIQSDINGSKPFADETLGCDYLRKGGLYSGSSTELTAGTDRDGACYEHISCGRIRDRKMDLGPLCRASRRVFC